MRKDQLHKLLTEYTASEKKHKQNIIYDYSSMPYKTNDNHDKIYNFTFSKLIPFNTVSILKNERFAAVPTHVHDFIEINYMYSGSCEQTINGKTNLLKKGQMTLIDTNTPHSLGYTGENDIMMNIIMSKDYLNSQFFSKLTNDNLITSFFINALNDNHTQLNYMIFNTENNERLQNFLHELILEYYQPSLQSRDIMNSLFVLIVLDMMNTLDTDINLYSFNEPHSIVVTALQYIERNYLTCTLESTANHVHVNPCYLTSLLKKHFHKSYKEIIIQLRMNQATKLLLETQKPISDIARECGYQNLTFFYRKFNEIYQCSPKEYRNNIKKSRLH